MRFLGLGINNPVPDAKTIWLFRDKLTQGGMVEKLFAHLDKLLDKDGIIVHKGKLVDASIVEVSVQRNSRRENEGLKAGTIPSAEAFTDPIGASTFHRPKSLSKA